MKCLKSYKAAAVFMIAAITLLSVGYDVQRSANTEWKARSGALVSLRNECVGEAKSRALSYDGTLSAAKRRLVSDIESCETRLGTNVETVHGAYEKRMESAAAILVFGIMFLFIGMFTLFDVFFDSFIVTDRKAGKALREEIVRMRVTSIQRRARLAKREIAMQRLEMARS